MRSILLLSLFLWLTNRKLLYIIGPTLLFISEIGLYNLARAIFNALTGFYQQTLFKASLVLKVWKPFLTKLLRELRSMPKKMWEFIKKYLLSTTQTPPGVPFLTKLLRELRSMLKKLWELIKSLLPTWTPPGVPFLTKLLREWRSMLKKLWELIKSLLPIWTEPGMPIFDSPFTDFKGCCQNRTLFLDWDFLRLNAFPDPFLAYGKFPDSYDLWFLVNRPMLVEEYYQIAIFAYFSVFLAVFIVTASYMLATQRPESEKLSTYECGFEPYEDAKNKFDVQFYVVAILFVLFDIEIIVLLPWCLSLSTLTMLGYWSMIEFLLELGLGFVYVWCAGALDW